MNRKFLFSAIFALSFLIVPRASAAWFCFNHESNPPHVIFAKVRTWLQPYFDKYPCSQAEIEEAKNEQKSLFARVWDRIATWAGGVKKWGSLLFDLLDKLSK